MSREVDFEGILRVLAKHDVDYFLVGGLAVGYHGYIRGTKDVDLVPAPNTENLRRLIAALEELDASIEGEGDFEPNELPDFKDLEVLSSGGNWVLQTRLGRLDILQWIDDCPLWEEFSETAVRDDLDGVAVKVIGLDGLLWMKRKAGRPSDLLDIERLTE